MLFRSPAVMTRLVDSSEYGNTYLPDEVLNDLFIGMFVAGETPDTYKRNLQSFYVDALISVFDDKSEYDDIAKAAVFASLQQINKFTKENSGNIEVRNHFLYLSWKVNSFFEDY